MTRSSSLGTRGFVPPSRADWSASWQAHQDPSTKQAYLRSCWAFDGVLSRILPATSGQDALEIGCYPGGFLRYLHSRFGFRVSGLDFVPETASLAPQLAEEGVDVGTIYIGDVREITPEPRFDLVASFGFIEHFEDPAAMIRRHLEWLAPHGWLVIEVPHFRRAQWALHRAFDAKSLGGHNVEAMSRRLFARTLDDSAMEIHHLGFVGTCQFWYEPDDDRGRLADVAARASQAVFGGIDRALARINLDLANPATSPFLICVARRR